MIVSRNMRGLEFRAPGVASAGEPSGLETSKVSQWLTWRNRFYYWLKPCLSATWHLRMRRWMAKYQRSRVESIWPILERSARVPEGWMGWPEGKEFCLVLTHDVETGKGMSRCRELMTLEEKMGFRSSFNLVPERYPLDEAVLEEMKTRGFEVGVHGLKHDGKLYASKSIFEARARRINEYMARWGSVGFRSPFMHHRLDWLHSIEMQYDASTFDVDPFEPQPDGVETIFPFLVRSGEGREYVELPYTLPQDSTLFLFLEEEGIETWKRKLDWIAKQGGMALVVTHPDYMNFDNGSVSGEYPAGFYKALLSYVQENYEGRYWMALPREVAGFWKGQAGGKVEQTNGSEEKQRIAATRFVNL